MAQGRSAVSIIGDLVDHRAQAWMDAERALAHPF